VPLTVQARGDKECKQMESGKDQMEKMHLDWLSSLDLDEDVLQKIKENKLKHKEKVLELKNQVEKKKLEMEKVLIEKKLDFNKILSIHDEIANLKQKISRKMIEQKIEMYKLIPDDKKEKAREIFLHKFLGKRYGKSGMHGKKVDSECPMKK
jgi:Spy/CpxP family protein refolding chaperone